MSSMWIGSLYKNGPTQHICMSGIHSSTYFSTKLLRKFLEATLLELTNILHQAFGDRSKCANFNRYHCFFLALRQGSSIRLFFRFLLLSLCGPSEPQNSLDCKLFVFLAFSLFFWPELGDPIVSKIPREFHKSDFLRQILICAYTIR